MNDWQARLEVYRSMDMKMNQWVAFMACTLGIVPKKFVEIGVYRANSARRLRSYWPDAQLYLVDPWACIESRGRMYAKNNTQRRWDKIARKVAAEFEPHPNVHVLRMTSDEAVSHIPDDLDLVFIDGLHTREQVTRDIRNYLPKINRPGLICGDDFGGSHWGVKKAVTTELGFENLWIGPLKTWCCYLA